MRSLEITSNHVWPPSGSVINRVLESYTMSVPQLKFMTQMETISQMKDVNVMTLVGSADLLRAFYVVNDSPIRH